MMKTMSKWDDYFVDIVSAVSKLGSCNRAKVGAVIVKDKRIISTGYNGSPSGTDSCNDVGCLMIDGHCKRTIHAEVNAVLHGDRRDLVGSTLYCTHLPCHDCTKTICQVGIKEVVYLNEYRPNPHSEKLFLEKGVQVRRYTGDKP